MDYRYQEAQARYYAGQASGLKIMEELASVYKDPSAEHFLINEARARGDLASAERMMEKSLGELKADEVDHAMNLVDLYITMGQLDKCLKLLEKINAVYPRYAKPYVIQGAIYRERKLFAKAEKFYRKALAINKHYDVARLGVAECEFGMGHWDDALTELRRLRDFDPTNPYYLLREARYLYETGEPELSRKILTEWVDKAGKEPTLSILLYHGLTPFKQDPRLAIPGNYRLDVFTDHIRALKQAGYTPVSAQEVADWMDKKHSLPEKPILVTFDDGRLDSLRYADPVLERYNFKATMFSTLANAGGSRPIAYASWSQLLSYQQTRPLGNPVARRPGAHPDARGRNPQRPVYREPQMDRGAQRLRNAGRMARPGSEGYGRFPQRDWRPDRPGSGGLRVRRRRIRPASDQLRRGGPAKFGFRPPDVQSRVH